jgi:ABC-type transport system involved in cytochrome c biogenesis permease subunit
MNTVILSAVTFVYLGCFVMFLVSETTRKGGVEKAGRFILLGGFVVHTAGIALRWVESHHAGMGHAPLSNFYESLVFFSWSVVFLYLVFAWKHAKGSIGAFVMPVAFLLNGLCLVFAHRGLADQATDPCAEEQLAHRARDHVLPGICRLCPGIVFGIISMRQTDNPGRSEVVVEMLDNSLRTGYILFTLGIVTGSVWAHVAWGRYWGWDPKETWALITWFIYTAAIHVRIKDGHLTRRFVVILIVGLAAVLFTYFGVNYLPGLHSYQ